MIARAGSQDAARSFRGRGCERFSGGPPRRRLTDQQVTSQVAIQSCQTFPAGRKVMSRVEPRTSSHRQSNKCQQHSASWYESEDGEDDDVPSEQNQGGGALLELAYDYDICFALMCCLAKVDALSVASARNCATLLAPTTRVSIIGVLLGGRTPQLPGRST